MTDRKATAKWLEHRLPLWQDVADRLRDIERGKSAPPETVLLAVRSYPEIARDLAIAKRDAPNGTLTRLLEQTYLQLHRTIYREPTTLFRDLRVLFVRDAAAVSHWLRWHILAVTLLFIGSIGAGAWLVASFPELVSLFASEAMIEQVRRGELWTDGLLNVFPSSLLAIQIFTNNIVVSLFAVCLGVLYGLGTIYIIALNGLMLGGVFAFTSQYSLGGRLFEFICAHGFVELSVICIAGAVGASLGEALARPGHRTRAAAFQAASLRGSKLIFVCIVFLVGAGLIEGYVSPNPSYPIGARLFIGLAYWALFVTVLSGVLDRRYQRSKR